MGRGRRDLPPSRRLKKAGIASLNRLTPWLYHTYMAFVARTSRVELTEVGRVFARRRPGTVTTWAVLHQDIFVCPYLLRGQGVLTFTNVGDAGDVITALLTRMGFLVERGGSSSRVSRLVPVMTRILTRCRQERDARGAVVAFACDGSRGPAGAVKGGIALFAMKTHSDVFCVKVQANRALYLRTWDRTMIPLPFGRIRVLVEGPIEPPAAAGRAALEAYRERIESTLHGLHDAAFAGRRPIPELVSLADAPAVPRKGRRLAAARHPRSQATEKRSR